MYNNGESSSPYIYMDHSTQLATGGYAIHMPSFDHSIVGGNYCKTKSGSGLRTRLILTWKDMQ